MIFYLCLSGLVTPRCCDCWIMGLVDWISWRPVLRTTHKKTHTHTHCRYVDKWITIWEKRVNQRSRRSSQYCPATCVEELRQIPEHPKHSQSSGKDLNPGLPEYETRIITARPWHSVWQLQETSRFVIRPTEANIRNEYIESVSPDIYSLLCLSGNGHETHRAEMKYLDTRRF